MATQSETLQIIIRLRDQATRGLRQLTRVTDYVKRGMAGLTGAVFSLQGAIAGLGIGLLSRQFINTAASFEAMETKLDALTKGKGTQTLEALNEWALRMPVNTQKTVQAFTMMQAMGLDPTLKKMETLVDVAVLFGEDAMPRVARALGQMQTLGKLAGEELNQLSEIGINARKYLTQELGMTVEQLQRTKTDVNKIVKAILTGMEKEFGGSARKMMNSWSGLTSTLASYWTEFQRRVMKTGVFEHIKFQLAELNKYIDKMIASGEFDLWAARVAVTVITSFQLMTRAVKFFLDAAMGAEWSLNRIAVEAKKFRLTAMRMEFNRLFKALDEGGKEAEYYQRIWGEDWQTRAAERVRMLQKEIDELTNSATYSAEELYQTEEALEGFSKLIEKALETLAEARRKAFEPRKKPEDFEITPPPRPKPPPKPIEPGLLAARASAEAKKAMEINKTLVSALEQQWEQHNVSLDEYFRRREQLLNEQFEIQQKSLQKRLGLAAKEGQREQIRAEMFSLRQEQIRQSISLEQEYRKAIEERNQVEKESQEIITEIKERILSLQVQQGPNLSKRFELENKQMMRRQQQEIDALLEMQKKGYEVEEQLNEAKNQHILEQEQVAANQRKVIWETYISSIQSTLTDMTDMFLDWYKASGEKSKELFTLFKAASIARALIATYESATKAYNAMVGIPIVGPSLATTAAAVAIAAGLAKVQLIRQQQMAGGGLVEGKSPHPKADNINIKATAGEFMQPVDVVRHYTERGMEVIRQKKIPREVLLQFASSSFSIPRSTYLAGGGSVSNVINRSGDIRNVEGNQISIRPKIVLPENLSFIGRRLEAEIEPVVLRVIEEELNY